MEETDSEASQGDMFHESSLQIEELLHEGQNIMVQVAKEPLGNKGARLTSHISLPGRHLVLMPTVNHIGVSRRIEDKEERERLKGIIRRIRPGSIGFIVRTVAEAGTREKLAAEIGLPSETLEQYSGKNGKGYEPRPCSTRTSPFP